MNKKIRIISDGTNHTTEVLGPDGEPLPNVESVVIGPIRAGTPEAISATVVFVNVELDIVAETES